MTLSKEFSVKGKNGIFTGLVALSIKDRYSGTRKKCLEYDYMITTKVYDSDLAFGLVSMVQERIVESQLKECEEWLMEVLNELANREDKTKELVSRIKKLGYK